MIRGGLWKKGQIAATLLALEVEDRATSHGKKVNRCHVSPLGRTMALP